MGSSLQRLEVVLIALVVLIAGAVAAILLLGTPAVVPHLCGGHAAAGCDQCAGTPNERINPDPDGCANSSVAARDAYRSATNSCASSACRCLAGTDRSADPDSELALAAAGCGHRWRFSGRASRASSTYALHQSDDRSAPCGRGHDDP